MNQPTDTSLDALQEVRRLLAERESAQQRVAAIDRAIRLAVGIDDEDRPDKERLSRTDFRTLCGNLHERVSKKKRSALDRSLA